eukprot:7334362-Alexandrium_andersonii.AAC.1
MASSVVHRWCFAGRAMPLGALGFKRRHFGSRPVASSLVVALLGGSDSRANSPGKSACMVLDPAARDEGQTKRHA